MPAKMKPDALRQRRNKVSTAATLPTTEEAAKNKVPPLPKKEGGWHPMVRDWWDSAWRSPMASEWLRSDMLGGLYDVAMLRDGFWSAETSTERVKLASEIRLQEVRFGLSPIDRSRLRWELEKGEQAAERTEGRRQAKKPRPASEAKDPRASLKVMP
jgi:hypothetical protein